MWNPDDRWDGVIFESKRLKNLQENIGKVLLKCKPDVGFFLWEISPKDKQLLLRVHGISKRNFEHICLKNPTCVEKYFENLLKTGKFDSFVYIFTRNLLDFLCYTNRSQNFLILN